MPRSERLGSGPQEQAGSSNRDPIFRFCDPGLIKEGVIKSHLSPFFLAFSTFCWLAHLLRYKPLILAMFCSVVHDSSLAMDRIIAAYHPITTFDGLVTIDHPKITSRSCRWRRRLEDYRSSLSKDAHYRIPARSAAYMIRKRILKS